MTPSPLPYERQREAQQAGAELCQAQQQLSAFMLDFNLILRYQFQLVGGDDMSYTSHTLDLYRLSWS